MTVRFQGGCHANLGLLCSKPWNWDYAGEKNDIRKSGSTHPPCLCGKSLAPTVFTYMRCSFFATLSNIQAICSRHYIFPTYIAYLCDQLTCMHRDQRASEPTTGPRQRASLASKPSGIDTILRSESKDLDSNGLKVSLRQLSD